MARLSSAGAEMIRPGRPDKPYPELASESRLGVLGRLGLLDTPPQEAFDRLTRLATQMTGAPIGVAVLVDHVRQFFVSQVGLPETAASRRGTPIEDSYCQHVVGREAPLIVADARVDELMRDNLAAQSLGLAYAGVPLVVEGECVGSLCLMDSQPRAWSEDDLSVLRDFAAAAMAELSLRLALEEQSRIVATLTESEKRYRSVVAAISDGVVLHQPDGTIAACNAAAEAILGLTADQIMGRTSRDPRWRAIHEDGSDFPGEDHPATATMRTGEPRRDVVMGVHKPDGDVSWISITTEPLDPGPGASLSGPFAVVSSFTDITDQRASVRALEESQAAAQATADLVSGVLEAATNYAIVATDAQGLITVFNRGAERMIGFDAAEVIGIHTPAVFHDMSEIDATAADSGRAPGIGGILQAAARDGVQTLEVQYVRKDGRRLPVSLSVSAIRDRAGEVRGYVGVGQDITGPRRDQARLAAYATEQEALRAVATLVASEAQPRTVFAGAAEHAARVVGAEFGAVCRLESDGEARLIGTWSSEQRPPVPVGTLVDIGGSTAIAAVLRTGRASEADTIEAEGWPSRSGLAAPIEVNGALWGAVSVGWSEPFRADPQRTSAIARFADLVRMAVIGSEAREQLSRMASTDHLTGLYNQRTFSDRLEAEVSRAVRHARSVSLVVFDIDHFKLVNDNHGHDAGNRVLSEFAARLMDLRRGGDIIARVGGEEFAWILPETDREGALAAAKRARHAIAGAPFDGVGRITTSAGVCALADAEDARQLFRHADLALYWAKSNGRDAVFAYSPDTMALLATSEQTHRLERAKALAAIRALATAVDAKDPSTQRHSERVADLAADLARISGWDTGRIAMLHDAALVHDVGKIGVPDQILLKPGKLTALEFDQVKSHAALGAQMLLDLLDADQIDWIQHHHERFDGGGYPDRLSGDEISPGAGLLAVADAWDAMTVARPYGTPRSPAAALREIRRCAGTHFRPDAVAALEALRDEAARAGAQPIHG